MTIPIPTASNELEEMLNDSAKITELFNGGQFNDFIRAYADAARKRDGGEIEQQVEACVQKTMASYLKDLKNEAGVRDAQLPVDLRPNNGAYRGTSAGNTRALYNKRAIGAKMDHLVANGSPSDYFRNVWHGASESTVPGYVDMQSKIREIQNSFGSIDPAAGGFLIPEILRSQLLQVALESAVVRPRATVIPMESLRVPIPMIDVTSNVNSVFGGIVAYWTEESAALTESQATFGRVVLDAKKLTALAHMPNELIADASAFSGFFDTMFPKAMAFYEDYAFLRGTGAGEPLGSINCPAVASVAAEAGQPTATIVYENLAGMYARMLPASLGSAVWIASIDTFKQLATMALSVGTGGSAVWLGGMSPVGGASATPPLTIFGRPVYFTEKVPSVGTTGDISFVDLSYYLIGDRQQMVSTSSPHFRFNQDQTSFRIIERVDGRPWLSSPITPKNGGATLSPFVQLATRP